MFFSIKQYKTISCLVFCILILAPVAGLSFPIMYGGGAGGGGSGTIADGTAAGQMAFWDAGGSTWTYTDESTELFWDDTNKSLVIPKGTLANPGITFPDDGDNDTGFYQPVNNAINVVIDGATLGTFSGSDPFNFNIGSGASIRSAYSSVLPSVIPSNGDANTGMGKAADDQLSLIAGGVEGIRISEDTTIDVYIPGEIGIDTLTPAYDIDIGDGTTAGDHDIRLQAATGDDVSIRMMEFATNKYGISMAYEGSDDKFYFYNHDNSEIGNRLITILRSSGRTGWNQTSPSAFVHIVGDADNEQLIVQSNSTQTDDVARIGDVTAGNYTSIIDNGTIDFVGDANVEYTITTVNSATYDLVQADQILHVTYTATGAVTSLTLPTALTTAGRVIHIKDAAGNATTFSITIDTEGAEDIDGQDTLVINTDYGSRKLYCDGSNWFILYD